MSLFIGIVLIITIIVLSKIRNGTFRAPNLNTIKQIFLGFLAMFLAGLFMIFLSEILTK